MSTGLTMHVCTCIKVQFNTCVFLIVTCTLSAVYTHIYYKNAVFC